MKRSRIVAALALVLFVAFGITAWAGVKEEEAQAESPVKIHLKHTEPRTLATMMHKGPFEQIPGVIENLMGQIIKGDHLVAGPLMVVYYNDPREVPEEEYLWEVWVPVAHPGAFGKAENDMMVFKYLDAMFVAYTYHIGPYESIGESYDTLFEWAGRNAYDMVGAPVEVYWSDMAETPADKLVTEIWLPVNEKEIPGGIVK